MQYAIEIHLDTYQHVVVYWVSVSVFGEHWNNNKQPLKLIQYCSTALSSKWRCYIRTVALNWMIGYPKTEYVYVRQFCMFVWVCVCVLAVYNKAQVQRISNREFKLWTESRVATFLAEACVMSHQSLNCQAISKYESPTAV